MPEPLRLPRHASAPQDGLILEYYDGVFESVYLLLHPFILPRDIDFERFNPGTWPSKQEIVRGCEPMPWSEVARRTGLPSLSAICVGLRTRIRGLRAEFANQEYASTLDELVEGEQIAPPDEGNIAPLIENRLLSVLMELGHEELCVGDEWGDERELVPIPSLIEGDLVPYHGTLYTDDHSLLVTTHWDSHYSLLCGSRSRIEEILRIDPFEGFFCTPKTHVYWGVRGV